MNISSTKISLCFWAVWSGMCAASQFRQQTGQVQFFRLIVLSTSALFSAQEEWTVGPTVRSEVHSEGQPTIITIQSSVPSVWSTVMKDWFILRLTAPSLLKAKCAREPNALNYGPWTPWRECVRSSFPMASAKRGTGKNGDGNSKQECIRRADFVGCGGRRERICRWRRCGHEMKRTKWKGLCRHVIVPVTTQNAFCVFFICVNILSDPGK